MAEVDFIKREQMTDTEPMGPAFLPDDFFMISMSDEYIDGCLFEYDDQQAKDFLTKFQAATHSKFVVWSTDKCRKQRKKRRLIFMEEIEKGFAIPGSVDWAEIHRCEYGGRRAPSRVPQEQRQRRSSTKKIGCLAKLSVKRVTLYRDFKVLRGRGRLSRTEALERLEDAIIEGRARATRAIRVKLPLTAAHTFHNVFEDVKKPRKKRKNTGKSTEQTREPKRKCGKKDKLLNSLFFHSSAGYSDRMATGGDLEVGAVEARKSKILTVGLVCLDIIKIVESFPVEDSDQRCLDCLWKRGGNASNTASVLSLLGAPTEFLGTLANGPYLQFLQTDSSQYGVCTDHCPVLENMASPVSVIILNKATGSRTILHTNINLRELTYEDFQSIPLASGQYSWIHLEGRPNAAEMEKMLAHIEEHNASCDEPRRVFTSLELEKTSRIDILTPLMQRVDFAFISKEVAQHVGFTDCETAARFFADQCKPGGTVICPWGDKGAAAARRGEQVYFSPAFPPTVVKDTIGAGDTFNAAAIFALNSGKTLPKAIMYACKVAGAKCGMMGNLGLRGMVFS